MSTLIWIVVIFFGVIIYLNIGYLIGWYGWLVREDKIVSEQRWWKTKRRRIQFLLWPLWSCCGFYRKLLDPTSFEDTKDTNLIVANTQTNEGDREFYAGINALVWVLRVPWNLFFIALILTFVLIWRIGSFPSKIVIGKKEESNKESSEEAR